MKTLKIMIRVTEEEMGIIRKKAGETATATYIRNLALGFLPQEKKEITQDNVNKYVTIPMSNIFGDLYSHRMKVLDDTITSVFDIVTEIKEKVAKIEALPQQKGGGGSVHVEYDTGRIYPHFQMESEGWSDEENKKARWITNGKFRKLIFEGEPGWDEFNSFPEKPNV